MISWANDVLQTNVLNYSYFMVNIVRNKNEVQFFSPWHWYLPDARCAQLSDSGIIHKDHYLEVLLFDSGSRNNSYTIRIVKTGKDKK